MSKTTVIYHSADFDGIFCREIARKFLPVAELIGWDHGDAKIPFPTDGTVYVLDLSPDCFESDDCFRVGLNRIIWIDHHKSSIEKWAGGNLPLAGYRIDGVAACRLAWQWFAGCNGFIETRGDIELLPKKQTFIDRAVTEPLAVRLAGEYDIWDKRDPNAELFQHGLRSQELTADDWRKLVCGAELCGCEKFVSALLQQGQVIQYAQTRQNESIIKDIGFDLEWEGLKFLACNHARYNSHLFTAGLTPEHDACYGFKWTGKNWSVSLYHAPGKEYHDLSLIAVKHGGGGHRGACGFQTKTLPWLNAS